MATARPSRFIGSFGWQVLAGMVLGLALGLLARNLGAEAGQSGFALAETLRGHLPGLSVLLVSGYAERAVGEGLADRGYAFLEKPFRMATLVAAVGDAGS